VRTEVRVRFSRKDIPGAQALLRQAGCGPDVATVEDVPVLRHVEVWVTLEEADPRLPVLFELLRQHGAGWLEDHDDRYTEEELDSARLLIMYPNLVSPKICAGVEYGMTFDLSGACPACGTGGRQTSALFMDGEELTQLEGHRVVGTIFYYILVDEGLEESLLRSGATGLVFRSVYALMPDKRQIKLRWRQLCANRTLPPMSPRTTGLIRDRACEVCRRNGYFQTGEEPTRIVYRASNLVGADDVNMSWENLGYAILEPELRDSLLSYPWTLVTPKVRRVFLDAGVTELDWFPIRVEDED
jgi:hypothetical protein